MRQGPSERVLPAAAVRDEALLVRAEDGRAARGGPQEGSGEAESGQLAERTGPLSARLPPAVLEDAVLRVRRPHVIVSSHSA